MSRQAIPPGHLTVFERTYPFAWLGILAKAPPTHDELIYAYHDHGFALYSMRSPELTRLYLQVAPNEDRALWPDRRIWDELHARLETGDGWTLREGPVLETLVAAMRSFVAEPMQCGRLFLAGDAAHIVPPTGAKGMNLAMADVHILARALADFYASGREDELRAYSQACLAARLARRAFLVVDDLDAAPVSQRRRIRPPVAALPARVRHLVDPRSRPASPKITSACRSPIPESAVRHDQQDRHDRRRPPSPTSTTAPP